MMKNNGLSERLNAAMKRAGLNPNQPRMSRDEYRQRLAALRKSVAEWDEYKKKEKANNIAKSNTITHQPIVAQKPAQEKTVKNTNVAPTPYVEKTVKNNGAAKPPPKPYIPNDVDDNVYTGKYRNGIIPKAPETEYKFEKDYSKEGAFQIAKPFTKLGSNMDINGFEVSAPIPTIQKEDYANREPYPQGVHDPVPAYEGEVPATTYTPNGASIKDDENIYTGKNKIIEGATRPTNLVELNGDYNFNKDYSNETFFEKPEPFANFGNNLDVSQFGNSVATPTIQKEDYANRESYPQGVHDPVPAYKGKKKQVDAAQQTVDVNNDKYGFYNLVVGENGNIIALPSGFDVLPKEDKPKKINGWSLNANDYNPTEVAKSNTKPFSSAESFANGSTTFDSNDVPDTYQEIGYFPQAADFKKEEDANTQNYIGSSEIPDQNFGLDFGTSDSVDPVVQNARNLGNGRFPMDNPRGTGCAYTIGIATKGTPLEGIYNVDQVKAYASNPKHYLIRQRGENGYQPKAGDLGVTHNEGHVFMVTEGGGVIQDGTSRGTVWESPKTPEELFKDEGGVDYYVDMSSLHDTIAKNTGKGYDQWVDNFISKIYGTTDRGVLDQWYTKRYGRR